MTLDGNMGSTIPGHIRTVAEGRIEVLRSFVLDNMAHPGLSRDDLLSMQMEIAEIARTLRAQANMSVIASKVPVEVLVAIFNYCVVPLFLDAPLGESGHTNSRALIRATHVCRRWRAVAIATPALWTVIDNCWSVEQVEAWLNRSNTAPLSLFYREDMNGSGSRTRHPSMCDTLRDTEYSRLRRLDVDAGSLGPLYTCPWYLRRKAPMIECLTITSQPVPSTLDQEDVEDDAPFLFCSEARLKALAIIPVTCWLPSNTFPHLTHLKISISSISLEWLMHHFMRLLSSAPLLQYLHVSEADSLPPYPGPRVVLASLRQVSITNTVLAFPFHLLSYLDIPEDALVRVSGTKLRGDAGKLRTTTYRRLNDVNMEIYGADELVHLVTRNPQNGVLWISVEFMRFKDGDEWGFRWLSSALSRLLDLSSLTAIHVYIENMVVLTRILPGMAQLQELTLRSLRCSEIIEGKQLPWSRYTDSHSATFYSMLGGTEGHAMACPGLRYLGVETDHTFAIFHSSHVVRMAAARSAAGHRIQRIVIHGLPSAGDMVPPEALAQIVDHVDMFDFGDRRERGNLCRFDMRDRWTDPEVERYWTLEESERPPCHDLGPWARQ
ncbi:hypothetical protein C8Q76DRAFT_797409 [Earliella scabrosa]|nr:hypothetical protein C8Q76DRAFT_797409 [Earliella scabrosa]